MTIHTGKYAFRFRTEEIRAHSSKQSSNEMYRWDDFGTCWITRALRSLNAIKIFRDIRNDQFYLFR